MKSITLVPAALINAFRTCEFPHSGKEPISFVAVFD
jgi:hypothetical protein